MESEVSMPTGSNKNKTPVATKWELPEGQPALMSNEEIIAFAKELDTVIARLQHDPRFTFGRPVAKEVRDNMVQMMYKISLDMAGLELELKNYPAPYNKETQE